MPAGGQRTGAGRKLIGDAPRIKTSFTLTPANQKWVQSQSTVSKSRSDVVNDILDIVRKKSSK